MAIFALTIETSNYLCDLFVHMSGTVTNIKGLKMITYISYNCTISKSFGDTTIGNFYRCTNNVWLNLSFDSQVQQMQM